MPSLLNCLTFSAALLAAASFVPWARGDVKVWTETPGVMIMADREAGKSTDIKATGLRNEYVAGQIGLRTDAADDQTYSFTPTALKSGGASIAADHVVLYRAAEINVNHSEHGGSPQTDPARIRPLGNYPDALVPLVLPDGTNVANSIKLEANHTLSFWVDVLIPGDAKAGDYTGKIELKKGTAVAASVPVMIHVANAAIPADSTIPSIYSLRAEGDVTPNLDAYVKEIMAHRIQPTVVHYPEVTRGTNFTQVDKYNPDNKGWVSLYMPTDTREASDDRIKQRLDVLHKIVDHLKSKGLLDRTFIYLQDEPHQEYFAGIMQLEKAIVAEFPELKDKILDTLNSEGNDVDKAITHHVRALKCYGQFDRSPGWDGRSEWDKRRADGQQLWFYESNAQGVPYPTLDVNTPNLCFEPRVLGWAWWYEKAYGHLYWALMDNSSWTLNRKFPPGDGQLIYPGDMSMEGAPDWVLVKDIHTAVVSRRLKELRQGLQEWEMLKEAEKKIGREKVQAIVEKVYTSMSQQKYNPAKPMWSYSESDWDNARAELIKILEH